MDWGLENRLRRIIRPETGHVVMLAVDHGYFLGPLTRLEDPGATLEPLSPYADALMLARGVLTNCVPPETDIPMVLRVSGGRSILCRDELSDEGLTTSMDEAVRLNAAAVALSIFVGSAHERQTILNLSKLVDEGERRGVPVLAVTAVGKELSKRDARYLSLACRIAGGPKLETEMDVFRMARDALDKGAVGVDMGRNIWQNDHPVAMIRAVRAIVHEGATPEAAHELFEDLRGA